MCHTGFEDAGLLEIPSKFVEKARFVGVIFTDVEREYDTLLHLMTLGLDWTWRRRMMSKIRFNQEMRILDLACGTGLVTFALSRSIGPQGLVVGLDPSKSMLKPAIRKKHSTGTRCWLEFIRATGEFMPFRNETFEYETIGLALRNFGDKSAMFEESHRTLSNSGWFLSVDFVLPDRSFIRKLYIFQIFCVLPALGRLVSSNWHRTLAYLARSIQLSTPPGEICSMLAKQGFRQTFSERITLGVVALLGGHK
jgi:demethylmenaquinone methyltransferase/2-methoxy-6-polyprenyl-1,4-benzoquinol methylase